MKCLICKNQIKPFHVFKKKALFNKPTAKKNFGETVPMGLGYCPSCRHISSDVSSHPKWSEAEKTIYRELYSSFTPGAMSETQREYTKFLFKKLAETMPKGGSRSSAVRRRRTITDEVRPNFHYPPKGKVLEIGSHDGYFLNMFKKKGWYCRGIEPSSSAIVSEKKYGIRTIRDFFKPEYFGKEKFDLVIAKHVVEHVPNPLEFTRAAASLVKNNGYLYIEVPNSYVSLHDRYFPEFHVDHISYFTAPSAQKLISIVGGLEMLNFESTWAHMKFPFLHILTKKTKTKKAGKGAFNDSFSFLDHAIKHDIERFKFYYPVYLANLREVAKKYKKLALWGAGSCGHQFAIDGNFQKAKIIVVDPNKANQNKYLTVTNHFVHSPYVLRKSRVDAVLIASGWEDDVVKQIPQQAGRKIKVVRFSDLLKIT